MRTLGKLLLITVSLLTSPGIAQPIKLWDIFKDHEHLSPGLDINPGGFNMILDQEGNSYVGTTLNNNWQNVPS